MIVLKFPATEWRSTLKIEYRGRKDYGTGIPQREIEALARCLLPSIQKFFESEEGKLYDYNPRIPNEDLQQFVEMCFDKDSPMNERLRQTIIEMFEGDKK